MRHRRMTSLPLTLLVGIATGFFGAIPPGPLNVTIIRKASANHVRAAFRIAFGGAFVDVLICGGIGLGFGWILEQVVTNPWVKGPLALFLVAYGGFIVIRDRVRPERMSLQPGFDEPAAEGHPGRFSFLVGFFQGAANPALFVNWTFVIGFFVGHRVIRATPGAAAAFALGVGLGVFAWFALLIEMLVRLKNHPVGAWLRRSTVLAGLLLVVFGLYFTVRTALELVGR
jgi:L-lysine exporter family protein LysE/ArgO